jgi:hypothetical protein
MRKTGKAVLIFTSVTALMGIAIYFIYKQATKSTSSSVSPTDAYMKDLANVFSGISSAFGNPSSDIPASAWAGGDINSSNGTSNSSYDYSMDFSMPEGEAYSSDNGSTDFSMPEGEAYSSGNSSDSSDSIDTSEA